MNNRLLLLIITALLLVVTAGCSMPKNQLMIVGEDNKSELTDELEQMITEYIEKEVAHQVRGGRSFSAQEIYGTEQKDDGRIYVYLWTYFMEYYLLNDELQKGGGVSMPLVVVLEKDTSGGFYVAGHERPMDGSGYSASVQELFPEKYHDRIFARNDVHDLKPFVKQKAERYFSESDGQTAGFGIYLADSGELLLSEADIKAFHSTDNILELNEIGKERWNFFRSSGTNPKLADSLFSREFILQIEGKEICRGKFWSSLSSQSYSGIVIMDAMISDSTLSIQRGYPVPGGGSLDYNIVAALARFFGE